jgi:hypothetical protein
MLMLVTLGPGGATTAMGAPIKPDGTFVFSSVAPGDYRVQVQHSPNSDGMIMSSDTATEFGAVPITITDHDVTDLVIVTSPGVTATGRVVFEGTARPGVAPQALNIMAVPLEFAPMTRMGGVRVRDDWTFDATGLFDRRRFSIGNAPPGWYLKSVTYEGTDITDTGMEFKEGQNVSGLEIMLTERATELSGAVQDARARPVTDYVVVAFSTDSRKWGFMSRFVRSTRPNQQGRFSLKGLPPDEYFVVALDYLEGGEEGDPERLEKWRTTGTRVRLADGDTKALTLKLEQ